MTPEDRLREAMEARASRVEPSADALSRIEEKLMDDQRSDTRKRVLLGLGAAAAVAAIVIGAVALTDDDDEPVSSEGTTTTTSEPTTTTTTEPTTTSTTTAVTFPTVDPGVPIYPDPTTSQRFDDPVAAARSFATWAGYTDPVVGELQQGDARSGEVEVRAFEAGAPTTVLVRQLEDGAWYVIGTTTDSIQLATPEPGATLSSPQELAGQGYAFEGTIAVRLFADGVQEPIAQTFVTGRGDGVLGDFRGQLDFPNDTGATHGVLVMNGTSGEDGGATDVLAIRVRL